MDITKLIFLAIFENVAGYAVYEKLPEINKVGNITAHLEFVHIQKMCKNRHVCTTESDSLCTVRFSNGTYEYKNFENSCFLFLSNMCDNPGKEFSIVSEGRCVDEVMSRRMFVQSGVSPPPAGTLRTGTKAYLRQVATTAKFSPLYTRNTAFDSHACPLACPALYAPVCVAANRGFGRYFKFWTFENHCAGDLYYCKNWEKEFAPPPSESYEMVKSSPLSWSFCGAHRYLQFARFSESASSMAHYGWLQGDHSYQHILEAHQRKPGFG